MWAQLVVGKLITHKVAKGKQSVDTIGCRKADNIQSCYSKQSVGTIGCRKADNIQSCYRQAECGHNWL